MLLLGFRSVLTLWCFLFFCQTLELFRHCDVFCFSVRLQSCSDIVVFFVFLLDFRIVLTLWYFLFFILFPENDNSNRLKSFKLQNKGNIRMTRHFSLNEEQRHNFMSFKSFDTTQNMSYINYLRFYYYHWLDTSNSRILVPVGITRQQSMLEH